MPRAVCIVALIDGMAYCLRVEVREDVAVQVSRYYVGSLPVIFP